MAYIKILFNQCYKLFLHRNTESFINILTVVFKLVCYRIFENKCFVVSCRALNAVKSTQLRCFSSQYELPLFGSGIHLLFGCGFATSDLFLCFYYFTSTSFSCFEYIISCEIIHRNNQISSTKYHLNRVA